MCGRYVLYGPVSRYLEYFDAKNWPAFPDRFNIAPTTSVPVIRRAPDGQLSVDLLRWGLVPNWAKDPAIGAKLNNARGETVAEKQSFRAAYRKRRCIVPASGFYEWQAVAGSAKQPWYIQLKGDVPMGMAGLWESWTAPDGTILRTFCVITTSANEVMAPIHDRMPVILPKTVWNEWLSPDTDLAVIAAMIKPLESELTEVRPVSRKVSGGREEGTELIKRLKP